MRLTEGERIEFKRTATDEIVKTIIAFAKREVSFGESRMVSLGLVAESERLYTNVALLLSDQCPHTVKVAKFQGTSKDIFIDRQEFSGSVLKQLNEVYSVWRLHGA